MTLSKLQAALALSPTNKAQAIKHDGDIVLIQEYSHEKYRLWVVGHDGLVWGGKLFEDEIDELPSKYGVDPGAAIWQPLGVVDVSALITRIEAIETAIQVFAGNTTNLRTELLVIKELLNKA